MQEFICANPCYPWPNNVVATEGNSNMVDYEIETDGQVCYKCNFNARKFISPGAGETDNGLNSASSESHYG